MTTKYMDIPARIVGSFLVVTAYFIVLHVSTFYGAIMHFVADAISIPYFVRTKSWDVVIMLAFLLIISTSKLVVQYTVYRVSQVVGNLLYIVYNGKVFRLSMNSEELEKLSANEMIDDFIVQCEKEAEKLEITVDYYIAEFL